MTTDRTDLERFHAHARERADWQPGPPKAACRVRTSFGTPKPADHANCGGGTCGCPCHAPTDAERALWRQLAGEIDAYLGGDACPGCGRPRRDEHPAFFEVVTTSCGGCAPARPAPPPRPAPLPNPVIPSV